jgi:LCP family protein required for cell wall assembly
VSADTGIDLANDSYNIYISGIDQWASEKGMDLERSDVNMIATICPKTRKILLTSIPRDSYVKLHTAGQMDKLTHTGVYGIDETLGTVEDWLGIDLNYYVKMNFSAVVDIIDAIGGVTVDVSSAEAAYLRSAGFNDIKTGKQLLDGNQALCYARIRKIDSDWVRITRQREVVQSALQKVGELPLPEMLKLVDTVLPMVKTNIPEDKMAELILLLPKLKDVEFQQMTIPAKGTYGGKKGMGGRSMYAADFNKNAKILQEFLYPQLSEKPDGG